MPPETIGLPKIAREFRVGTRTVRKWIRLGAPILKIGRQYVCQPDQVWDWLFANKILITRQLK